MCFLPLKSSHYPSRPVPVPELFGKYPTRPVPKSKTPTRQTLDLTSFKLGARSSPFFILLNFWQPMCGKWRGNCFKIQGHFWIQQTTMKMKEGQCALLNLCRLLLVLKYCCSWTLLKVAQDCCNTERLPTCSNDIINCLLCRIRWPYHSSSASSGFCYLENSFFLTHTLLLNLNLR